MGETLSKPVTTKQTHEATGWADGERLRCGVSCMQGWRVSMEDAHAVHLGLGPDLRRLSVSKCHQQSTGKVVRISTWKPSNFRCCLKYSARLRPGG